MGQLFAPGTPPDIKHSRVLCPRFSIKTVGQLFAPGTPQISSIPAFSARHCRGKLWVSFLPLGPPRYQAFPRLVPAIVEENCGPAFCAPGDSNLSTFKRPPKKLTPKGSMRDLSFLFLRPWKLKFEHTQTPTKKLTPKGALCRTLFFYFCAAGD